MADVERLREVLRRAQVLANSARTPEQKATAMALLQRVGDRVREAQAQQPAQRQPFVPDTAEDGELVGVNPEARARIQARLLSASDRTAPESAVMQVGVPKQVRAEPSALERVTTNIAQGLTLGGAPWLQRNILGDEETAQRVEDVESAAMRSNPIESLVTQGVAGLFNPVGVGTGVIASAARTVPRAVGAAVIGGAGEGALEAYNRDMDRQDAALTVGLNALAPVGMGLLGNAASGIRNMAKPDAGLAVRELMDEANVTPQQLMDIQTSQPETIPELAARSAGVRNVQETPLGSTVRALNTQPGQPRQIVSENLQSRADDAQNRVERIVSESLGGERATIDRAGSDEAYQRFRDTPWPEETPDRLVNLVRSEPEIKKVIKDAQRTFRAENREAWDAMPKEQRVWNWQTMDNVKKALDSKISVALRKGDKGKARDLQTIRNDFLQEVESVNPNYAPARAIYADGAAKEAAQEQGRSYFRSSRRDPDIEADFAKLSDAEKGQFRIGALDEMLQKVETTAGGNPDYARRLIGSDSVRQRLRAISDNPDEVEDVINRLVIESRSAQATGQTLGGSPTAGRTAELNDEAVAGVARSLLNLNWGDAASKGLENTLGILPGRKQYGRDLADILSTSGQEDVRRILSQLAREPGRRPAGRFIGGAALATPPVGLLMQDE